MKNPLRKRLIGELKEEIGKYIVIFLFIAAMIALVSGFLVANDSMNAAYEESFSAYHIEDGNFELSAKADSATIDKLEAEDLTIYNHFYIEEQTKEVDSTLRVFEEPKSIDQVCLMEGTLPQTDSEIAIDRMYADNNGFSVGDTITAGGRELKITGLVALSDYSALFSNNSDLMFDAIKFGVAVVTPESFEAFGDTHLHYSYAWTYDNAPKDDTQAEKMSEDFLKMLSQNGIIVNYIPQYLNQAIHFTGDDMSGDNTMMTVFLYIVIVIIAFIIAITTWNTIAKESNVIGTLRASGYTKGELIRHYLTMPILVMLLAAIVGNILGYTVLKDYMADMYYNSYSLPTYVTRWNPDAFLKTTVVPLLLLFLINYSVLAKKMNLSPLKFIRRDLSARSRKKAFRLNTKIKFLTRFRIRIIFQNMPNYIMIFIGVFFANFILLFGLMFTPLLNHFETEITTNTLCSYQYVLKTPAETKTGGAEKFCISTLKTTEDKKKSEDVAIYGVNADSSYLSLDFQSDEVYVSSAYAQKYDVKTGDTITLKEEYGDDEYQFKVQGTYNYPATIAVFMSIENFQQTFDQESDYFNGYFSNQKISDINEKLIATTITRDDLTKTSRQLKVSMGNMMNMYLVFGIAMFLLIIYLLSKIIIEKNSVSISMAKILGYSNAEINKLYITTTTFVVLGSMLVTMPICNFLMKSICVMIFSDYSGWLPYYVPGVTFVKMFVMGALAYSIIAFLQVRKIRKIPMGDALKNVE